MAQIPRTTNDIIVNALYLTGELAVGESPSGFMSQTGLEIINEILDGFSADSIYIPFLTSLDFVMTVGKDTYSVSDIISNSDIQADRIVDLSMGTYVVSGSPAQDLIYPLTIINKATYYGIVRQGGLQSRPSFVFLNKQATESFVVFYPAPDQAYPCTLQVKVMLNSLSSGQDIAALPPFYYGFLKYAIARQLTAYFPSTNWTPIMEDTYQGYLSNLKNANETDVTIRPSSILSSPEPFYWQNILAY